MGQGGAGGGQLGCVRGAGAFQVEEGECAVAQVQEGAQFLALGLGDRNWCPPDFRHAFERVAAGSQGAQHRIRHAGRGRDGGRGRRLGVVGEPTGLCGLGELVETLGQHSGEFIPVRPLYQEVGGPVHAVTGVHGAQHAGGVGGDVVVDHDRLV